MMLSKKVSDCSHPLSDSYKHRRHHTAIFQHVIFQHSPGLPSETCNQCKKIVHMADLSLLQLWIYLGFQFLRKLSSVLWFTITANEKAIGKLRDLIETRRVINKSWLIHWNLVALMKLYWTTLCYKTAQSELSISRCKYKLWQWDEQVLVEYPARMIK